MGVPGDKERVRRLAAGQAGRISWAQLRFCGLSADVAAGWIGRGELVRARPRVYALGHLRTDPDALLWEAILYAGPGACLTAGSGAHVRGLINWPPRGEIVVATPHKRRALPGISVLGRRDPARVVLPGGLPVAPLPDLMLDLAAREAFNVVRHALGVLDFRRELDEAILYAACRRGRPGSRALRRALERRLAALARCRSPLEVDFVLLLEAHHLAIPRVNHLLHGIVVDMYWPELGLVVELDGRDNHHSAHQKRLDAAKTEILNRHGLTVIRFDARDVRQLQTRTLATLAGHGLVPG